MGCMIEFLDLTEEQTAAWESFQQNLHAEMQVFKDEMRGIREDIRAELDSDSPDATALGELMIASHAIGLELREMRQSAGDEFASLLTDDQREKFETVNEFQETCRGAFGGGKGSGRGGHGRPGGGQGGNGGPPQG
jgi:Spy/CpxP family protein refolding chaperone